MFDTLGYKIFIFILFLSLSCSCILINIYQKYIIADAKGIQKNISIQGWF